MSSYTNPSSAGSATMTLTALTGTGGSVVLSNSLSYASGTAYNVINNAVTGFTIASGDALEMQWSVPAWTTSPTSVRHTVTVWFKRVLA
jgi:hypothetical protein